MENTEESSPSIGTRLLLSFVVIIGLALIVLGCYLAYRQVSLQFFGERIQGEVTEVTSQASRSGNIRTRTTYHASYRFTTPDGKTFEGEAQVEQEFYNNPPRETEVFYDPSNPSVNAMPASAARWVFPGFALAAGFIILVLRFRDKTPEPWVPLEKNISGGIKLSQSEPKPTEWLLRSRRPVGVGGVLLGIGLAVGWNSVAGILAYACLKSESYVPFIIMSPLILMGVLMLLAMLLGFPVAFVAKCFPVFELCLDREPKPGEEVNLFWRCLGFYQLFGRLIIDLNQEAKRERTASPILDCKGGKIKEGQVEFRIPDQCGPKAWHLFVEGKRLFGPNTCQKHPIPENNKGQTPIVS